MAKLKCSYNIRNDPGSKEISVGVERLDGVIKYYIVPVSCVDMVLGTVEVLMCSFLEGGYLAVMPDEEFSCIPVSEETVVFDEEVEDD